MFSPSATDRIFILTGAGISAESGIPTFRGEGGLWRNYRIEEVASPYAGRRDPQLVWEFYSMRRHVASAAKPNPGYFALANSTTCCRSDLFYARRMLEKWKIVQGGIMLKPASDRLRSATRIVKAGTSPKTFRSHAAGSILQLFICNLCMFIVGARHREPAVESEWSASHD